MSIQLREVKTAEAYDSLARIRRSLNSRRPSTVEALHAEDREWPDGMLLLRFLLYHDDEVVGEASCAEAFWTTNPELVRFEFELRSEVEKAPIQSAVVDQIESAILRERPQCPILGVSIQEDRTELLALLRERGYGIVLRNRRFRLDVTAFDAATYVPLRERLESEGIRFLPLTTVQAAMPAWKEALRDLRHQIHLDVPLADAVRRPTLQEFEEMVLSDPALDPEAWWLAMNRDGDLIGISNLWINDPERKRIDTGLTGVLRDYRRRGIATVLKVGTIAYAQAIGAHWIDTKNEEENPMFRLNEQLGFVSMPASLVLRRVRAIEERA